MSPGLWWLVLLVTGLAANLAFVMLLHVLWEVLT